MLRVYSSGGELFHNAHMPHTVRRNACKKGLPQAKAMILDAISQATHLWQARLDVIAVLLATRSYRETLFRLKQVTGFGGTGFMAKEIVS